MGVRRFQSSRAGQRSDRECRRRFATKPANSVRRRPGSAFPPASMTRIKDSANMRRFYKLDAQSTLFGEWSLVREWGRLGVPVACASRLMRAAAKPTGHGLQCGPKSVAAAISRRLKTAFATFCKAWLPTDDLGRQDYAEAGSCSLLQIKFGCAEKEERVPAHC